jgi:hypothetical protein
MRPARGPCVHKEQYKAGAVTILTLRQQTGHPIRAKLNNIAREKEGRDHCVGLKLLVWASDPATSVGRRSPDFINSFPGESEPFAHCKEQAYSNMFDLAEINVRYQTAIRLRSMDVRGAIVC